MNLTGPFMLVRAALPHLLRARGAVVSVSSVAALRASEAMAAYSASKAGLLLLTQSLAVDHGPDGLRANVICPGWTTTEMADMEMAELGESRGISTADAYQLATAMVPQRRAASADEVAGAVCWLLSDAASYVNGAVLPVDGGSCVVDPGTLALDPRVSIRSPLKGSSMSQTTVHTQLRRNALGVAGIVFLVLAAVAPLTGIVVVASLVIALGNGGGAPVSFFIVAIILLLFAVGYAQMSKQLVNAGGFYAFVVKGLGRTGGLIAGFIATLGYNFFVVGTIGTSGFFMQIVIADLTGFDLHWYAWGLASIIVSFVMARRGVDFSSKVLGVSLVCETLILVVFDISVLVQTGFDVSAFSPAAVFSGSLPIGLLLAATGYLGFEATALFSEEAKNPLRTIPRATYIAITSIAVHPRRDHLGRRQRDRRRTGAADRARPPADR